MNISFFYWFIWNKDFKWFISSSSNISKRKQFNFFSLTDRQADYLFLSWLFMNALFFHGAKEFLKDWVSPVLQLLLKKISISSANVHAFFQVFGFCCSCLFFISSTRDRRDNVFYLFYLILYLPLVYKSRKS